jgi:hypothetical protein
MYNWLKTMVNQVYNLRSTKWDNHEMVKVILRSLVFCNPAQVQLIRGDPRYKHMSPEEVIGKFVSTKLVAEPPKLLGPHAPVLVSKTSDSYACALNKLTGSV